MLSRHVYLPLKCLFGLCTLLAEDSQANAFKIQHGLSVLYDRDVEFMPVEVILYVGSDLMAEVLYAYRDGQYSCYCYLDVNEAFRVRVPLFLFFFFFSFF